jgi:hypothetical protein
MADDRAEDRHATVTNAGAAHATTPTLEDL